MIRVSKPRASIPKAWKPKAFAETQRAITHFSSVKTRRKKFNFTAYRDPEVKDALVKIFNHKCAYCEFQHKGGISPDIDHWRPKRAVRVGTTSHSPGYYWLGADWDNLFPACRFCNSINTHEDENGSLETSGKMDQFPVVSARARRGWRQGSERGERPLLLNPSHDDPGRHLEYSTVTGERGIVRPKLVNGRESAKGSNSIEVYALWRKTLVEQRRDLITSLLNHLDELKKYAARHAKNPQNPDHREDFESHIDSLALNYLKPNLPYLAAIRQFALPQLKLLVKKRGLTRIVRKLNADLPPACQL